VQLASMLAKDRLAVRSESLPADLSPEEVYTALFEPEEETYEEFLDNIGLRKRAWTEGKIMRKPQAKGRSPAQIKKIREYMAWLKFPVDSEAVDQ
jgi:hypothetical protein